MRSLKSAAPLSHYWLDGTRVTAVTRTAQAACRLLSTTNLCPSKLRGATARRITTTTAPPRLSHRPYTEIPHGARGLRTTPVNMSLLDEKHEWGAVRVRDTFLDFFKQRGHTFGEST